MRQRWRTITIELLLLTSAVKPRQSWSCSNECVYASDGICSDGGAGSEFSTCEYGYDCSDCGIRCSCDNIAVSSTETYVDQLALGVYSVTGEQTFETGNPQWVYRNANGWHMLYNDSNWQLKPSLHAAGEALVKTGFSSIVQFCPGEGRWLAWNGSTWNFAVSVTCNVSTPMLIPPPPRDLWWVETPAGPIYVIIGVTFYLAVELLISIRQTLDAHNNSKGRWTIPPSWRSTVIRSFILRALLITAFLLPVPVSLAWQIQQVSLFVWRDGTLSGGPAALAVVGACTCVIVMLIMWPIDLRTRWRRRLQLGNLIACVEQPIPPSPSPTDSDTCERQTSPTLPNASGRDLTALLVDGTVMVLSIKWLLNQPEGFKMKRRQELPPEAFVAPALTAGMLEVGDIIALSYRWLHQEHPDPAGWHMQRVRSFLSIHTHWKALLMDYASLPQKGLTGERSREEQAMFKAGLKAMGMVYATPRIAVLQDKGLPSDLQGRARTYDESGWCTFEEAAASLATRSGGYIHDVEKGRVLLKPHMLSMSRHEDVMAKLRSKDRTNFYGDAEREDVIRMYKDLLQRIKALDNDIELTDGVASTMSMDRLLTEQSTDMRLARLCFHLIPCLLIGLFCFGISAFDLSTAITAIGATAAAMSLILAYCRVVLFASPHFVELFKHVWAGTRPDAREYVCISFPFHEFWLLGKPLLLHHSDLRFRSKSNQVVPSSALTPSADQIPTRQTPDRGDNKSMNDK